MRNQDDSSGISMPKWPAWVLFATMAACTYPAVTAPQPGTSSGASPQLYRALGTEPFWSVTIRDGRMIYEDSEQRRVAVADFRHRTTFNGHRYESPRLTLDVTHAECSDGMSNNVYRDTVRVTVDGRELEGCGTEVTPPAALAGTEWRITDINGDDVSGEANYMLRFDGARLSGRAGCNSLSGPYRSESDGLIVGPVVATRMACPGPRMRHEAFVLEMLQAPVNVSIQGDTLLLSGEHGFIRLRRAR